MIVLYTAILGGSDRLKPAPSVGADRCICFTDDTRLVQNAQGWEIRLQPVGEGDNPRRLAWQLRCRSHVWFPGADLVVWLDASMFIRDFPRLVGDAGDADLVGMRHPERTSCVDEAEVLVADEKATLEGVTRQVDAYLADGYVPLSLTTAGILLRRHTPRVCAFNRRWASELARYPDDNTQLSLDYCAWKEGVPMTYVAGTYIDNPYLLYDHEEHARRRRPYR